MQHLDGDCSADARVYRPINDTHTTLPDNVKQLVTADLPDRRFLH
jgi:hypothetical protein